MFKRNTTPLAVIGLSSPHVASHALGSMIAPSPWMWILAAGLLLVGLLHGRSRRGYPPVWVCGLLVLGALLAMCFLLNVQFGGQVLQIHLP